METSDGRTSLNVGEIRLSGILEKQTHPNLDSWRN